MSVLPSADIVSNNVQNVRPTCLTCGNRSHFLVNMQHRLIRMSPYDLSQAQDLRSVICGRCGGLGSVVFDDGC